MGQRSYISALITVIVCLLAGCASKADAPASLELADVQASVKRIEEKLENFRDANPLANAAPSGEIPLVGVHAALKRIEGELITLRQGVPPEADQKLKELQILLSDRNQWPLNAPGAERLRLQFDEIVQALSPVAAERILPELSRLNWGVEALWILRTYANADANQLDELQAIIDDALERQPRGHFVELQGELKARLQEIDPQVRAFQVQLSLERAQRALDGKEDASAALSSLDVFREGKEVAAILPKLRAKVIEKSGLEGLESYQPVENLRKISPNRRRWAPPASGGVIECRPPGR